MKYSKYNAIIVGSGISGLYLANKLAQNNKYSDGILVVTKSTLFSGSSALAQGGIVSVIPEINPLDSIESHIKDTMNAGCGLNDLNVVKFVSENSSSAADSLMKLGVEFDKNSENLLNFTLEGAHSHNRILHCDGDSTGRVIEETLCKCLLRKKNVEIYENTMLLEILVDKNSIARGIVTYNSINKEYQAIYSNCIILATGGVGQIFKNTTNPKESTADGIACASLAGAVVSNMEFIQFHPTALYCKNKSTMPLVSESVRGEGARLVDVNGVYFAKNYHCKADLAPRDVVARAITSQISLTSSDFVNLDISQIGVEKFKRRFPTITKLCMENNVDISSGLVPVVPAEHYCMGGIKTDINSCTNINNLYAIGECASTGLHGANRLASNSLLECVVFAQNLANILLEKQLSTPKKVDLKVLNTIEKYGNLSFEPDEMLDKISILFEELRNTMTLNSGINRSAKSLDVALNDILDIKLRLDELNPAPSREKYELNNVLYVATLIVKSALARKNSVGAHYRTDYLKDVNDKIDEKKANSNDEILVK